MNSEKRFCRWQYDHSGSTYSTLYIQTFQFIVASVFCCRVFLMLPSIATKWEFKFNRKSGYTFNNAKALRWISIIIHEVRKRKWNDGSIVAMNKRFWFVNIPWSTQRRFHSTLHGWMRGNFLMALKCAQHKPLNFKLHWNRPNVLASMYNPALFFAAFSSTHQNPGGKKPIPIQYNTKNNLNIILNVNIPIIFCCFHVVHFYFCGAVCIIRTAWLFCYISRVSIAYMYMRNKWIWFNKLSCYTP